MINNLLVSFGLASLFLLFSCGGDDVIVGLDRDFIIEAFDLSDTTDPLIIDVDETDACPQIELDSTDSTTYQVRIPNGDPVAVQTTFLYSETSFTESDNLKIMSATNETGSDFELRYTPLLNFFELTVDYDCQQDPDNPTCSNAEFTCSGPLI